MCAVLFAISVVDAENSAGKGEHLAACYKYRGVNLACRTDAQPGDEQACAGAYHGHRAEQLGSFAFHELISFF